MNVAGKEPIIIHLPQRPHSRQPGGGEVGGVNITPHPPEIRENYTFQYSTKDFFMDNNLL